MEVTDIKNGKNERIKVLMSAYACEPNKGSEPGVGWNWATHMAEYCEVYVITRSNNQPAIEADCKEHPLDHIHFFYHDCGKAARIMKKLPNGIFIYYKMWQRAILPIVREIIEKERIDIVHHVTFNEFRTPGKLYKLGVPFVWGPIGGGQFYNPVFHDVFFSRKDIAKEKIRNGINKAYLYFSRDIHQTIACAKAVLIADPSTEAVMPQTRKYLRLLETAYNTERNTIKTYVPHDGPIRLLWIGGIWPRKGLKLLLDALGDSDFREFTLDVIGDGQDKNNCIKLCSHYGIQNQVHFRGALSYELVNQQYDSADVFVFTSLRDTSGNVVLEAMSHGLPVIALDHHGVSEMVTCETGTKIAVKTYEQIKKDILCAICEYQREYSLIKMRGMAGRERVENVYSWNKNAEIMFEVYKG